MDEQGSTLEELEDLARSGAWVGRLSRSLVADRHLAEDVVQEAYLRSLRHSHRAGEAGGPTRGSSVAPAWFKGIVRHVAQGWNRDRGRRRDHESMAAELAAESTSIGATDDEVARLEQQSLLLRALLDLDEAHRSALILRYVEGHPPRAIARRTGLPVATVNSRLARGLAKLRAALIDAHGGDEQGWLSAFAPLLILPTSSKGSLLLLTSGSIWMKKQLMAALVLLVVGALSWFAWAPTFGISEPESPVRTVEAVPPTRGRAAQPPAESTHDNVRESSALPTVPSAAGAPLASETRSVLVEVLDRASGEPVSGARLYALNWSEALQHEGPGTQLEYMENLPEGPRSLFRDFGRPSVADGEGNARVPLWTDPLELYVEHGQTSGTLQIDPSLEHQRVFLERDRPLRVQVLDHRGQGLGDIPVMLAAKVQGQVIPLSTGTTAVRDALDSLGAELVWPAGVPSFFGDDLIVGLAFPTSTSDPVSIRLEDWPMDPVVLRCPAIGGVRVRAFDVEGKPVEGRRVVRVVPHDLEDPLAYLRPDRTRLAQLDHGEALVWPLELGLECVVAGWFGPSSYPALTVFEGPKESGSIVEVELHSDGVPVTVLGAVLGEDGLPLANRALQLELTPEDPVGHLPLHFETDEQGRFEAQYIRSATFPIEGPYALTEYTPLGPKVVEGSLRPRDSEDGVDVGVLQFQGDPSIPKERITSGRVLDAEGLPVVSATLRWVEPSDPERPNAPWIGVGPLAFTGSRGEFSLLADEGLPLPRTGWVQVEAHASGYHEPVELTIPSKGNVIALTPGATLRGRIRLEPTLPRGPLAVVDLWDEAQGEAPTSGSSWGWRGVGLEQDSFRFDGVAPGRYTLRIGSLVDRRPVLVRGILVDGTGDVVDARLDPVDLWGRYREVDLHPVNEEGRPLAATVHAFGHGFDRDGKATLVGPEQLGHTDRGPLLARTADEYAWVVRVEGYYPERVDPRDPPTKLVMTRGYGVTLEWIGEPALADLPFELTLRLSPVSGANSSAPDTVDSYMQRVSPSINDGAPRSLGTVRVRAAGEHRILWGVRWEHSGIVLERELEVPDPPTVYVHENSTPLELTLSEEALRGGEDWIRSRAEALVAQGHLPTGAFKARD